jgi:hypothetical protein
MTDALLKGLIDALIDWLAEHVQSMLDGLVSFLTAVFFTSPDVTVFPQVQFLADRSVVVLNAGFGLAIVAAGAIGLTHGTFQIRYQVKDLLPRLVFAFVIANFGVPVCRMLIEMANALTVSMLGQTASGPAVVAFVKAHIEAARHDPGAAVLAVVIGLVIVVVFYTLLVGWFARITALIVLAGIAPLALACYCLPQTQAAAQLWWRSLLGCLATPLLQGVVFTTGVNLLLDPAHNVPILPDTHAGPGTDVLNLFIVACLLMITVRIPKLIGRYVTRGSGSSGTAGVLLRAVVIQSITRRLHIPGRR